MRSDLDGCRRALLCDSLPLPRYCPEFYRAEFESKVADMKNSVKDRMNAQSSCAANFVAEAGLPKDWDGQWLVRFVSCRRVASPSAPLTPPPQHVDLAGPSVADERGTGFGVALALALLEVPGFEPKLE